MGLLSLGTPLDWNDSKQLNNHVRHNGILQLIRMFRTHKNRDHDPFLWGDEIEYMLVDLDSSTKTAKLDIAHENILDKLGPSGESFKKCLDNDVSFHPEYGRFMIESTPLYPYNGEQIRNFLQVESNMLSRRKVASSELPSHIVPLTLTTFPRMGCPNFISPDITPSFENSQSLFLPDQIINSHTRFPTLTSNIRKRRGSKVSINLPIYKDKHTKMVDESIPERSDFLSDIEPFIGASLPGHVYLDAMGFGMGCSCLQITMQSKNLAESRYLYDALAPVTPIMLALSSAAPFFKGYIVGQDVRWNVISGAVDDRTFFEKDVEPYQNYSKFGALAVADDNVEALSKDSPKIAKNGDSEIPLKDGNFIKKIPKSRYDSINSYLSSPDPKYNDLVHPINTTVYNQLIQAGFDHDLANHFGYLFIRDPLVVFSERIDQNNETENDHFENIQSTNWQTLRFKPPSGVFTKEQLAENNEDEPNIGWRVEFRPMEIQITDFENAAYAVFISLLSRALSLYTPDFYIPLSLIDDNMSRCYTVNCVTEKKFWFKDWKFEDFEEFGLNWFDNVLLGNSQKLSQANGSAHNKAETYDSNFSEKSINEIINGTQSQPGLLNLVVKHIAQTHSKSPLDTKELAQLQAYLKLISYRASGKVRTIAKYLRDFVNENPLYSQDSKINEELNFDIIDNLKKVSKMETAVLVDYFGEEIGEYLIERSSK